ncbi:DUF58 domain-containing protein [Virgibacillus sp. SK37]|uniref:DUF58 domain-containing protein n=1 Tax=Virgibacillus sp. SK37 TaxID=403957 RepID=UPI0004D12314|nr:DUF58 domain-containing protein [Virgibacillus sp. SK37]AIF45181.1 hypothetical protein X953_03785 [Virgibacillus sp. SK37]
MKWKIENTGESANSVEILVTLMIAIMIGGMIWNNPLTFILAGFIGIYILLMWQYSKRIGQDLKLTNPKQTVRLFEGEEAELEIKLTNYFLLPYFNGQLTFSSNEKIKNNNYLVRKQMGKNKYKYSFYLGGKKVGKFLFPFQARQRGTARLENIQVRFPHLFDFRLIYLKYCERYQTEIIVYPRLETVSGIKEISSDIFGEQHSRFSPFEDTVLTKGTRDYISSDPFNKIHWKATARKQALQTKELEPVKNLSWSIVINIAKISPLGNLYNNEQLERFISQAAYISRYLIQQGFPVEIYINSATFNHRPYHLPLGEGREHLKSILEFLARFEDDGPLLPMHRIYRILDSQTSGSRLLILIGEAEENTNYFYEKWAKGQKQIFHVKNGKAGVHIRLLQKGGEKYDKAK